MVIARTLKRAKTAHAPGGARQTPNAKNLWGPAGHATALPPTQPMCANIAWWRMAVAM